MSAIIRRVLDRLYPRGPEYTVPIFGEPWGGKTTLLYLLKLGEVVPTISSIGFNIETVNVPTSSKQSLKFTGWDIGGGCQPTHRMIDMMIPYLAKTDAIIWIVDASDTDRQNLAHSAQALRQTLDKLDPGRNEAKKDYPILILANKQDLPVVIPLHEIREAFGKVLSGRSSCIFGTSLVRGKHMDSSGLPEAFDWLQFALENASAGRTTSAVGPALPDQREASLLEEKIESWVARAEADDDPQRFIAQFHSLSLPAWDHYTHIRIAFLLLTTYGRQRGKDMIFDGIEKYISESPQARGRTFHVTMTYFWIQVVHLGIRNMLPSNDLKTNETMLPSNITGMASPEQFALFLALNTYVADGNLWADYYSKEVMMSPGAKGGMVLPDKKPLPNLVVRDAISKQGSASGHESKGWKLVG
ncbi:hypothetical protein DXG01_016966 [Tephrocybe rancida]|nr:hypothetical protein DXG01_016966 [Tephrocybe rancida]